MSTSASTVEVVATDVRFETDRFYVQLADGREVGVPYEWFWRLGEASVEQRRNWCFIGGGSGIHWPDIDEDISVKGILAGRRGMARPSSSMAA